MTSGTPRFVALDALRGLCAIFVCLFHFHSTSTIFSGSFVRSSWQFVDFFFVLSGFVIAANYRSRLQDGMPIGRFLGLRLGRIYPLHVFVLGLFVIAEVVGIVFMPPIGNARDVRRGPFAGGDPDASVSAAKFRADAVADLE